MTKEEKIEQARTILAKYGKELLPEWEGYKFFWHAWHSGSKLYPMKYTDNRGYIERIIEIEGVKPEYEWKLRYLCFRPVIGEIPDFYIRAHDEYTKAWINYCIAKDNFIAMRSCYNSVSEKCYEARKSSNGVHRQLKADYNEALDNLNKADSNRTQALHVYNTAYVNYEGVKAVYKSEIEALWLIECSDIAYLWSDDRQELVF